MAQRFDEFVNLQFRDPGTGAASGLMNLSRQFQGFRDKAFEVHKRQVIEEQTTEGQAAFVKGQAPEFKEEGFIGGVSARAFNDGLRHSYMASISNDVRKTFADLERDHADDPIAYQKALAAERTALEQNIDPTVLPDVLESFDQNAVLGGNRVRDREAKRLRVEQADASESQIQQVTDDAMIFARNNDMKASALAIKEGQTFVDSAVNAKLITPAEGEEQKRTIERLATQEGWKGWTERLIESDGVANAMQAVNDLATKPPQGFTQPEWDALRSKMQQTVAREQSRQNAVKRENLSELKGRLQDWTKAQSLGFDVDATETDKLAQEVAAVSEDAPELKKQFDIVNQTGTFSVMSAANRSEMLAKAQTGQIDDVDQYAALVSANDAINKAVLDDGYGFASKQGIIDPIPFDANNPDSFAMKVEQAQTASQHYGVPISPLSKAEVKTMVANFPEMTSIEKMSLANTLRPAPEVWGQIAKAGGGTFAMAGATGDVNVMESVFMGQELLDTKTATAIKSNDYLADFQDFTEGVYSPSDARDIMNASVAYYAQNFDRTGAYDSGDFEDAIQAVTGGIGKVNGMKYELPRGVDEDDFNDFVQELNPQTIDELGGVWGMDSDKASEVISQLKVVNVKSGVYMFQVNDVSGNGGNTLFRADDPTKPFIFEWSPELAAKNTARNTPAIGRRR